MSRNDPSKSMGEGGKFDASHIPGLLKGYRLSKPLIAAVEGAAIVLCTDSAGHRYPGRR